MTLILNFLTLLGKESNTELPRLITTRLHCIILILINFGLKRVTKKAVILILLIIFSPISLYKLLGEMCKLSRMEPHVGKGRGSEIIITSSLGNSLRIPKKSLKTDYFSLSKPNQQTSAPALKEICIFFFQFFIR